MLKKGQEKLLVVRMDRIGDTLVTTPAIKALRKLFPHASIDFLARSFNKVAVERNPYINTLYEYPKSLYGIFSLLYSLRKQKYDAILVMNACSRSTSWIVSFLGCDEIWGLPDKRTRRWYTNIPAYDIPIALIEDGCVEQNIQAPYHVIVELLVLVEGFAKSRSLSLSDVLSRDYTREDMLQMDFFLDDNASLIQRNYPKKKQKRIAFFIGNAKKIQTRWSLDKFIDLSHRLLKQHADVEIIICVGEAEEKMLIEHNRSFPEECLLFGGSLSDAGALLQTVDCFITSSTSYMHIAGALRIPTISLLGGYTYHVWRPLGTMQRYIVSNSHGVNVESISVDEVYDAICQQCSLEIREAEKD